MHLVIIDRRSITRALSRALNSIGMRGGTSSCRDENKEGGVVVGNV